MSFLGNKSIDILNGFEMEKMCKKIESLRCFFGFGENKSNFGGDDELDNEDEQAAAAATRKRILKIRRMSVLE